MPYEEPPLTKRELKIIRGMIDEYEYHRMHEQERKQFWTDSKVIIASFAAVLTVTIQLATFVTLLVVHHG